MFVEIENAIVSRLEARLASSALPRIPRVYTAADFEAVRDRSQGDATITVAYNGIGRVTPLAGSPLVVTVEAEFYVWVTARSASRAASQKGTRELADPLITLVMQSLCGWRPGAGEPPLELSESPSPAYEDGFGHFPFVFVIKQQVRGTI